MSSFGRVSAQGCQFARAAPECPAVASWRRRCPAHVVS